MKKKATGWATWKIGVSMLAAAAAAAGLGWLSLFVESISQPDAPRLDGTAPGAVVGEEHLEFGVRAIDGLASYECVCHLS